MKVLGIVGSPRKGGNTEIMVEEALAAAREAGAETEIASVAGKNIAPCDGCSACHRAGVCHIKDDMQSIYPKLESADAIIFGTPVYFGGVSAQMKAIIDRTFKYLEDPKEPRKLRGKVAAPIVTARRVGAGQTRTFLYGFFAGQGMVPVRGAIGYGRLKGEVKTGPGGGRDMTALEEARITGREVVEMLQRLSNPG
jgi:multimeric flavodoxin WrbA